jgi:MOSC domain-containing protein YiiM
MPRLLSVNVGLPRDVTWNGKTVRTAVWKSPVTGRQMVRKLDIDGDAQGDLAGHGGEQRAVFVYQMDSYRYWERLLGRNDFTFGQFGENFTVEGLPDNEVRIGDQYRIGDAVFEVTQPRVTCYRVGIRMNEPRMAALLVSHRRPGFYFRVLQEGEVGAGDEIVRITDGPERITVEEIDALLYMPGHSRERLQRALRIPALSKGWQSSFHAMLQQDLGSKTTVGNPGLAYEEQAPAWPGFRQMRVANIHKESDSVTSFTLEPIDGQPLPIFQAGQFVVLRLHLDPDKPPVLRSYSLSDLPIARPFPHQRQKRIERDWKFISVQSGARRRCIGCECTSWKLYSASQRECCGFAKRRSRRNACDVDAARTCRRKIRTRGVVDLWSAKWRRTSIRARIPFPTKATLSRTRIHRV